MMEDLKAQVEKIRAAAGQQSQEAEDLLIQLVDKLAELVATVKQGDALITANKLEVPLVSPGEVAMVIAPLQTAMHRIGYNFALMSLARKSELMERYQESMKGIPSDNPNYNP